MAETHATGKLPASTEGPVPPQRSLKRAALALAVLAVLPWLSGVAQSSKPVKALEEGKIVLQDATGKVRAEFGCQAGSPSLALFDDQGKCRARLAIEPDGVSCLALYDKEGQGRAVLHVRPEGEPQLDLDNKPRPIPAALAEPSGQTRLASGPAHPPAMPERNTVSREVEGLYRRLCASCHGSDGQGRRMRSSMPSLPDFKSSPWQVSRTDAQLAAGILNGRGTDMPAFDDRLNARQARELVDYIRAMGPKGGRTEGAAAGDFEKRWRQLELQWEELRKQAKDLSGPASS